MHPMWREVQSPRHRVLCHYVFDASTLPEVRKHKNTPGKFVRKSDGRGLSGDLGEDGERNENKLIFVISCQKH